ncbi:MAG: hypothetical protein QOE61_833 [Micromonosporaceae bacterium]|jgi:hypothetical protein|nr:hypothetical protein [Micromonosporaceae bacterium]
MEVPSLDATSWSRKRRPDKSARPHRINEAVRRVAEAGTFRRHRRAMDSTILADAMATQGAITHLVAAVRRLARQVPGAAQLIAAVCTGHDLQPAAWTAEPTSPRTRTTLSRRRYFSGNALRYGESGSIHANDGLGGELPT